MSLAHSSLAYRARMTLERTINARSRKPVRLSQRRFARLIDVHEGTVARWETGERVPTSAARTLLRVIEAWPDVVLVLLAVREAELADGSRA